MNEILSVLLVGCCFAPPADLAEVSRKKLPVWTEAGNAAFGPQAIVVQSWTVGALQTRRRSGDTFPQGFTQ